MPEKPTYEELEKRLLESDRLREQSDALLELSPDIIGIGNLEGFFIKVNSAFEKLTGYTKKELYEKPFLSFIHENDVEKTSHGLDALRKGKQFFNIENRHKCTNGSYISIEWHVSASVAENRFHAIGRDLTDCDILNTAMDGFFLIDHAGRFIKVNKAYCRMSGYSEQELLSMSIVDMEGLRTGEDVSGQIKKILELGEDRFESLLRRKDGSLINIESSVQYSERHKGSLIAFVRDITTQKKARQEVWESKEKFRSLVELTSDWIWEVDKDGTYTYSSPQIKRLLGYQPRELVGKMKPFDLMPADEAKKISAVFKDIIASCKAFDRLENINTHKDGHPVVMETGGCPFFDVDGNLMGYRGVDRDITERKRMEEMMIQSEKMLSVGGLAAGMAHEINNPMAGMLQTAQVLAQRLKADANIPANLKAAKAAGTTMKSIEQFMEDRGIQRMIEAITASGERISNIVVNMLSFARKEAPAASTHHLDKVLDKALELAATDYDLKTTYDFRRIKIIREYDEDLPAIPCQGSRIQQVLLNILTNGAQAMHTAKTANPRLMLRLRKEKSPDMIRIEIEDNGPGMDEKTRSKVFDPFFTTKPIGIGTGLGLSISYFIITENHSGIIDVISEPGQGANFIIRLPVH